MPDALQIPRQAGARISSPPGGADCAMTILATVVFQPARRAVEGLASRLVYGERLTGYQAVSRLGVSLEEAAAGTPVRRLLKTHRDRIAAVVRPAAARLPAGPAPWSFISKR